MLVSEFIKVVGILVKRTGERPRLALDCVCFNGKDGELQATDGHRLLTFPVDFLPAGEIMPIPAEELRKLIEDKAFKKNKKEEIRIERIAKDALRLYAGGTVTPLSISSYDFPNVKQFTSKMDNTGVPFDAAELKKAVKIVRPMTTKENRGIYLFFAKDRIIFAAFNQDLGQGEHSVYGDTPEYLWGKVICVNADYFIQALVDCLGKTVRLRVFDTGKGKALQVREELIMLMGIDKLPGALMSTDDKFKMLKVR